MLKRSYTRLRTQILPATTVPQHTIPPCLLPLGVHHRIPYSLALLRTIPECTLSCNLSILCLILLLHPPSSIIITILIVINLACNSARLCHSTLPVPRLRVTLVHNAVCWLFARRAPRNHAEHRPPLTRRTQRLRLQVNAMTCVLSLSTSLVLISLLNYCHSDASHAAFAVAFKFTDAR